MIKGKKIVVGLPAHNAEITLEDTVKEIPRDADKDSYIINQSNWKTSEIQPSGQWTKKFNAISAS